MNEQAGIHGQIVVGWHPPHPVAVGWVLNVTAVAMLALSECHGASRSAPFIATQISSPRRRGGQFHEVPVSNTRHACCMQLLVVLGHRQAVPTSGKQPLLAWPQDL